MARGAIISMLSVIFILPAMFMLFDKVIGATTIGFKPKQPSSPASPPFEAVNEPHSEPVLK